MTGLWLHFLFLLLRILVQLVNSSVRLHFRESLFPLTQISYHIMHYAYIMHDSSSFQSFDISGYQDLSGVPQTFTCITITWGNLFKVHIPGLHSYTDPTRITEGRRMAVCAFDRHLLITFWGTSVWVEGVIGFHAKSTEWGRGILWCSFMASPKILTVEAITFLASI